MQTLNVTVLSGQIESLSSGLDSAIFKRPITQATALLELGLQCDQQADKKHHGGVDRALHLYPQEHYQHWQSLYPHFSCFHPGSFGENLSTLGAVESQVCIGDVFTLGDAVVQVSQPRSPCFKLNHRFNVPNMALMLQVNGFGGYLFRVLQPGLIEPHSCLSLLSRDHPDLTVKEVAWQFFNDPLNRRFLQRLMECSTLSESWKIKAKQRLASGMVEDWNKRLFGFNSV